MKKILALALAVMLALSATAVVWAEEEESDWVIFEPLYANSIEWTSDDFESERLRAFITVMLILDLDNTFSASGDSELSDAFKDFGETVISESSYVGRSGDNLLIVLKYKDKMVSVAYEPALYNTSSAFSGALYKVSDALSDSLVEYYLEESCADGYYKNTLTALRYVLNVLAEYL